MVRESVRRALLIEGGLVVFFWQRRWLKNENPVTVEKSRQSPPTSLPAAPRRLHTGAPASKDGSNMGSNDASSSGDAELDALVRDLSRKVRTTEGRWVRDQTPLDGPDIGAGARLSDAAASAEAQAEALIAALDDADADAGLDAGARVVDVADFDRFATAEMKQEADDIIALMMKYENASASGSVSGRTLERSQRDFLRRCGGFARGRRARGGGRGALGRGRRRAQGADEEARRGLEG
jgi:hypothetical protein